jgi:hypothetical protein
VVTRSGVTPVTAFADRKNAFDEPAFLRGKVVTDDGAIDEVTVRDVV